MSLSNIMRRLEDRAFSHPVHGDRIRKDWENFKESNVPKDWVDREDDPAMFVVISTCLAAFLKGRLSVLDQITSALEPKSEPSENA